MIVVVVWFTLWAFTIVDNLNSTSSGPDEALRILVPTYIYEHHQLPTGYQNEVTYPTGNWSYAFYPQLLGAIVSAFFMSIVSIFSDSVSSLIFGARLSSVLFGALTVYIFGLMVKKILSGQKYAEVYSYLAMILLAFWPQFTFLSSYINNDIVALSGVSIILYASVLGLKDKWNVKNTVILGLGFAICLLGYTNSYGFILFGAILFILTWIKQRSQSGFRRWLLILMLTIAIPTLLAGPFFVRNAIIYHGDFLGLSTFKARTLEWERDNNRQVQTPYNEVGNNNVLDLVRDDKYWNDQEDSFVGKFGYMSISPAAKYLLIYKFVALAGIVGSVLMLMRIFLNKNLANHRGYLLFSLFALSASFVTFGLSIYYSLTIDIQPQGRYIIYLLIPLLLISVVGIKYLIDKTLPDRYMPILIGIIISLYAINSVLIFKTYLP